MTLDEFLLARIAEDEEWAKYEAEYGRFDGTRVLVECDAKRRIIEAAWADLLQIEGEWGHSKNRDQLSAANDYPEVVQLLALPYADHPDYDEAWRP